MKRINMLNIEEYLYLFDGNDTFNGIGWIEPIYIAMVRAYQNDKQMNIITDNSYLRQMIENHYQKNKTYTPIEKIT